MLTLTYAASELSFHLIYWWNRVVWPHVTHSSSRRRPKPLMTLCADVSMQGNVVEAERNMIQIKK